MATGEVLRGRWLVMGIARLDGFGGRGLLDFDESFVMRWFCDWSFQFRLWKFGIESELFFLPRRAVRHISIFIARGNRSIADNS